MRSRLYVVGVLGGLALLAVTVVVVFAFGRYDPSPPSLKDNPRPEIPGEILYVDEDMCFRVAAASGEREERLGCLTQEQFFTGLYWIDDETAGVILHGPAGATLYEVDLRTAQFSQTGRSVNANDEKSAPLNLCCGASAPDGTYGVFEERGELILVKDGVRTEVADLEVARFRQPQVRGWSPDSQWLLVQYFPRDYDDGIELWIVSSDGSVRGTLAKDVSPGPGSGAASWRIGDEVWPPTPD